MSVEKKILAKITAKLKPIKIQLENQSHLHAGHQGSPETGESHFSLMVVSEKFIGLNRVQQQRLVYQILKDELSGPVHALALSTSAPPSTS